METQTSFEWHIYTIFDGVSRKIDIWYMCEKYIHVWVYIVGILTFFWKQTYVAIACMGIACKEKDNTYSAFKL